MAIDLNVLRDAVDGDAALLDTPNGFITNLSRPSD